MKPTYKFLINPSATPFTKTAAKPRWLTRLFPTLAASFLLVACTATPVSGPSTESPSNPPPTAANFALTLKAPSTNTHYLTTNAAGHLVFELESQGDLAAGESYSLVFYTNTAGLAGVMFETNLSTASLTAGKWRLTTNADYSGLPEGDYGWKMVTSNTKGATPAVTKAGVFGFRYPPQAVSGIRAVALERKPKGNAVPVRISWTEPASKVTNSGYQVFWSQSGSALEEVGMKVPAGTNSAVVLGFAGTQYRYKIVTTNALSKVDPKRAAASSTESHTVFSLFKVTLKAPTEKYLTTNEAGNIGFELEAEGDLTDGELYSVFFSTNSGSLSEALLQTSLNKDNLADGKWSYTTNVNYSGLPEGEYGWTLEYKELPALGAPPASPAVTTNGSFSLRYPPQAVTELSAVTLVTNAGGTTTQVKIAWKEPALKVTNSGYQVFWGWTGGGALKVVSSLPVGRSNVVLEGTAGAEYAYKIVTTNALSEFDAKYEADSGTVGYPIPRLVFDLEEGTIVGVEQEKYFHGEANSITLRWQLSGALQGHQGQQVWWGKTKGTMKPVTNLDAAARSVTLSSNVIGKISGSRTAHYRLRGTNRTAVVDLDHLVLLESCAANQGDYVMVCSRRSLEGVNAKGLGGKYRLQNDINLGGKTYTKAIIAPDPTNLKADGSAENNFSGTRFTGEFDGAGKQVFNGVIDGGERDYLGLFGELSKNGVVKRLAVGLQISNGDLSIGGVVGRSYGTVSNVYATGAVSGKNQVGGAVGLNAGGTLIQAYASGAVNGSEEVGGLVGDSSGTVSNAYATGAVSGKTKVGGLVGNSKGAMSRGYATGTVSRSEGASSFFGYVLGKNETGGTTNALFHSSNAALPSDAANPGNPTVFDGAATQASFSGFDFDKVWKWSATLKRPVLRHMPAGAEQ